MNMRFVFKVGTTIITALPSTRTRTNTIPNDTKANATG